MSFRILIVIPTYNEAANILELVNQILEQRNHNYCLEVVIVDDSSPDGTAEIVARHPALNDKVFLIRRKEKNGRGGAVLAGFQFALERGYYDYVVEMDSDFSHDPQELLNLIGAGRDRDLTVGSRYLPKSRIVGWSFKRRIFSRLANCYARAILKIPLSDYTNGYRCYRVGALQKMDFTKIRSKGYIVLSELAYQLYLQGARLGEIPIVFVNRQRGGSNFSLKEVKEAFLTVPRLYRRYTQERKLFKGLQRGRMKIVERS